MILLGFFVTLMLIAALAYLCHLFDKWQRKKTIGSTIALVISILTVLTAALLLVMIATCPPG